MIEVWPADILLTRVPPGSGKGDWITRAIERATRDDPLITFTHAALVVSGYREEPVTLIEAWWPQARFVHLDHYTQSGARWMLLRKAGGWPEQRVAVVEEGLSYEGRIYPIGKLGLQLLDVITGSRFFTRALGLRLLPVCSGLVARAYKDGIGFAFRDDRTGETLDPESVRPDDIHDHASAWPHELQAVAGEA